MLTINIIKSIVDNIDLSIKVKTITIDIAPVGGVDGKFTLTTCNTKWLQPKKFSITIDAIIYTIESVVLNESFTIIGSEEPTIFEFNIYPPKYYHGTIIQTTNELDKILKASDKTPMVYLVEPFKEKKLKIDHANDRIASLRLFFITQAEYGNWLTKDFWTDAIPQMQSLWEEFIESAAKSKYVGLIEEFETIAHSKLRLKTADQKGKDLFNSNFSGVEMEIDLPIVDMECC